MATLAEAGYAASWTTEGTSGEMTVTEAEWMDCTDPQPMLGFIQGKASERKLRLFAVACCRRIWHLLSDEGNRTAVEVVERTYDSSTGGLTHGQEQKDARMASQAACRDASYLDLREFPHVFASRAAYHVINQGQQSVAYAAENAARAMTVAAEKGPAVGRRGSGRQPAEMVQQCNLLRDIFGNPFRSITISPSVLAWNNAVVVRLAQAAYEERHLPAGMLDNGRLAVLADALDEAGCTDADLLGHLRGPGPHVRGCWVVDLVLGKS